MAQTIAEIEIALRSEYPTLTVQIGGVVSTLGQSAYDARIAEMALAERQRQLDIEADAARKDLRRQARLALTTLNTNLARLTDGQAMSLAQMRPLVADLTRVQRGVIQVLIDRGTIEATD